MSIELVYLETCGPDYFNGFNGHVYAIPVNSKTTYSEVKNELLQYIADEEVFDIAEGDYLQLKAQCFDLFNTVKLNNVWSSLIEDDKNGEFYVYAYFGVNIPCL